MFSDVSTGNPYVDAANAIGLILGCDDDGASRILADLGNDDLTAVAHAGLLLHRLATEMLVDAGAESASTVTLSTPMLATAT